MTILVSALVAGAAFLGAVLPAINIPAGTSAEQPLFPAPPGYLLPWPGGQIQDVTQGEETTFTHNLTAAYAFDFGMNYDTVVAARSGKVTMVREDSNLGGCSAAYSSAANYVVIDHGDGTSALYLHLAYNSAVVQLGQEVARGEPIAISGETGVTCADDEHESPGPHLHFQVQRTDPGHYFSQSLPVAFDDIPSDQGVAHEGRSYVSGNYGRGKPQKIALTPWRVPRIFNPTARPANPLLIEADLAPPPPPPEEGAPVEDPPTPTETPLPLVEYQITPEPSPTDLPTETPTPTPIPTDTPIPAPVTDTPVPPTPAHTDTPTVVLQEATVTPPPEPPTPEP